MGPSRLGTIRVSLATIALAGCSASPLPSGATAQSVDLHRMWLDFFWIGLSVAVVIWGLIIWCLVAFRRRPGREAAQFRNNAFWTWIYVGLPVALVVGLFLITYPAERSVETIVASPDVRVRVTGFRWSWRFEYPELGASVAGTPREPPVFELPTDETARMDVVSVDVDHSFWIPDFLFKRDAIPGIVNEFDLRPTKLGLFRGECGEFCGLDHAVMSFGVRVVPRAEFARWIAEHKTGALTRNATP